MYRYESNGVTLETNEGTRYLDSDGGGFIIRNCSGLPSSASKSYLLYVNNKAFTYSYDWSSEILYIEEAVPSRNLA